MDPKTKKTVIRHFVVFSIISVFLWIIIFWFKDVVQLGIFFTLYTLLTIILHYYYISKQKVRLAETIKKEEDMLKQKEESSSKAKYLSTLRKKKILEEQAKAVHSLLVTQNHKINSLLNGIIGYCSILINKIIKQDIEKKDPLINIIEKIKQSGNSINKMMKEFDDPESHIFKELLDTQEYLDLEKEYLEKDMN